jgi:hypothetical protein
MPILGDKGAKPSRFIFPRRSNLRRKLIGHHKANVVTGRGVLRARIAETRDQANCVKAKRTH